MGGLSSAELICVSGGTFLSLAAVGCRVVDFSAGQQTSAGVRRHARLSLASMMMLLATTGLFAGAGWFGSALFFWILALADGAHSKPWRARARLLAVQEAEAAEQAEVLRRQQQLRELDSTDALATEAGLTPTPRTEEQLTQHERRAR